MVMLWAVAFARSQFASDYLTSDDELYDTNACPRPRK